MFAKYGELSSEGFIIATLHSFWKTLDTKTVMRSLVKFQTAAKLGNKCILLILF